MGLRLPEDVSAAGYDGIQLASITSPAMTTYRQDTAALGKTAAAKLIELIEKPRTALVDRILHPGQACRGRLGPRDLKMVLSAVRQCT